ncbi:CLK4-associating serine/arginine rich protein-like [Schistocerca nitens]|uniref:CLK4-associating serine/arginine rich protein-like n=1 Tax=Schistocerca nitens TaxID=7011 RepID=UPI00211738F4|nr:CLK4-associating serine/arginine rich protein-like [Schistocerca nitens]
MARARKATTKHTRSKQGGELQTKAARARETAPQTKRRRRRRRRRQRPATAASIGGAAARGGGNAARTTAAPGGDSRTATAHVRPTSPTACGKGGGGGRQRDAASGKTAATAGPDVESALREAESRFRMVLHAEMEAACLTLRESLSHNTNKKEAQHQDDRLATTAAQPSRDQATQTAWPKKMTISRAAQASLEGKGEAVARQDSSVQTKEFVNFRAELVNEELLDDDSPRDEYQMSFLQSKELMRRKAEAREEEHGRRQEEEEAERDRRREAALARRERQRQRWQHGK